MSDNQLKPYQCPNCLGSGQLQVARGTAINIEQCHSCNGSGVVWPPRLIVEVQRPSLTEAEAREIVEPLVIYLDGRNVVPISDVITLLMHHSRPDRLVWFREKVIERKRKGDERYAELDEATKRTPASVEAYFIAKQFEDAQSRKMELDGIIELLDEAENKPTMKDEK